MNYMTSPPYSGLSIIPILRIRMSKPIYTETVQAAGGGSSARNPLRDLESIISSSYNAITQYNNIYPTVTASADQAQLRADIRNFLTTQAAIAFQSGQLYK